MACCAVWAMSAIDGLILAGGPGERRIARLIGDRVVSFVIDRGQPAVGDVFQGRVLAPGFIDIGAALPGYLPRPGKWREGDRLLVQVTAEPRQDKGAVLTDKAEGEPRKSSGLARALQPSVRRLLVDEPSLLPEAKAALPEAKLQVGAWSEFAADALELGLSRVVPFGTSGQLIIDEAAGATVIDIDAGGLPAEEASQLAAAEIARQLRLRGIGGQVLIDTPWRSLLTHLKPHLAQDPTEILGISKMQMIELVRPRRQASLADNFLVMPAPQRSAASLAFEALQAVLRCPGNVTLVAAPEIIRYLDSRPDLMAEMRERLGRKLPLIAKAGMQGFEVTDQP
jgi:ribonuclease G